MWLRAAFHLRSRINPLRLSIRMYGCVQDGSSPGWRAAGRDRSRKAWARRKTGFGGQAGVAGRLPPEGMQAVSEFSEMECAGFAGVTQELALGVRR